MEENKPTETAKEVAGKSIGRFGLFYITLIVLIGVGSSYFLSDSAITAVMTMIGGALVALINMMNGIAGTAEKQEKPEFKVIQTLIDKLDRLDKPEQPMRVTVQGEKVTVTKGNDVVETTRGVNMLELLSGGIFGSLLGGIFRLAPEVLKFFDKKNERQHEMAMFSRQCELEQLRGQQKLAEIGAERDRAIDTGVMDAFNAAINQQAEMAKAAGGWAAALSASVRPVVTYWVILLWSFIHLWFAWNAWMSGAPPKEVFNTMMTADFMALVSGTINYWFLDRTLKQRGL